MRRYKQLTYEERVKIKGFRESGKSIRAIARILRRSPNTISYELREKRVNGVYTPKKAQHKSYSRRYWSKKRCLRVAMNKEIQTLVEQYLEYRWSPERISGYLKRQGYLVSKKAIYKYIQHRSLERYLFWSWNKKKPGRKRQKHGKSCDGRRYIEERPEPKGSGHYEADFIVSSKSTAVLLVVVDINTRHTSIKKLPNRKHVVVRRAFKKIFEEKTVKSLTLDNDIAFNCWRTVQSDIGTKVYFTHPYCSWEKGLVENTNRWIRCFVPKKKDIKDVSSSEIQSIQDWLNHTPKQCLGFRSSSEVLLDHPVS